MGSLELWVPNVPLNHTVTQALRIVRALRAGDFSLSAGDFEQTAICVSEIQILSVVWYGRPAGLGWGWCRWWWWCAWPWPPTMTPAHRASTSPGCLDGTPAT